MTNKNSIALTLLCILNFQSLIMQAMNQPDYTSEFAELYTSSLLGNNGDNFAEYLQKFDAANHADNPAALYDYVGDFKGNNNISLFKSAIIAQDIAAVKKLTTHGANLHKQISGLSPLYYALGKENTPLAIALINSGATIDKNFKNNIHLSSYQYYKDSWEIDFYYYYLYGKRLQHYLRNNKHHQEIFAPYYLRPNISDLYFASRDHEYNRVKFLVTKYKLEYIIDALSMIHQNEAIEKILHDAVETYDYKKYYSVDIHPQETSTVDLKSTQAWFSKKFAILYGTKNVSSDVNAFNRYVDKFNKVVRSNLEHLFCIYLANYKNTAIVPHYNDKCRKSGHTLYEELLHTNNYQGVSLLVSKHANKNKMVFESSDPIAKALVNNQLETAEVLIAVHPDCVSKHFISLMSYTHQKSISVLQSLIDHGSNVNDMRNEESALTIAMRDKNYDALHLLQDKVNDAILQYALQSPYCKPDMHDILQAEQESRIAQKAFLENDTNTSQLKKPRVIRLEKDLDEDWSWRDE